MNWTVYILRCADGSLYTGVTNDLKKRLKAHRAGKGSKYVATRLPIEVVHQEKAKDRSFAQIREAEIKKLSRTEKLKLIRQP